MCMLVFGPVVFGAQSNAPPNAAPNLQTFVVKRAPRAQPKIPSDATNWGATVEGVQLLIYETNRIVQDAASITLLTVMINGSTNTILFEESDKSTDFFVLLTNVAGKVYNVTPFVRGRRSLLDLNPGEMWPFNIPVTFPKSIEPGDYVLTAERPFVVKSARYMLQSNPLRIQIKRATGTP